MAKYNVKAPDGAQYQINAPDDATPEQVQAYAQANYQHPAVQSGQGLEHPAASAPNPNAYAAWQSANRAAAINDTLGGGAAGLGAQALNYVGSMVDRNMAPDSLVRRATDSIVSNTVGVPVAAVHNADNTLVGAGQLAAHGISAATGNPSAANAADQFAQNREHTYQAGTPTNIGSLVGATAGQVAPWLVGLGGLKAAGAIPKATSMLGKIGVGALEGGAIGASQPVTGNGSFASQKLGQVGTGAALGGSIPAITAGASEVGNLGKAVFNPKAVAAQNIARLVGHDPATLAKLDAASPRMPLPDGNIPVSEAVPPTLPVTGNISGLQPTTAQAAPSASSVAAEKALRNQPGHAEQFVQRQTDNNASRLAVLQQHAGDEATMQAAKDARSAATQPYIQEHLQPATPATRWTAAAQPLDAVLKNPGRLSSGDFDALKQARAIVAKVKGGSMQEDDAVQAMNDLEQGVTSQKAQKAFSSAFGAVDQNMIDPSQVLRAAALTRNTGLGARPAVRTALDNIMATINQSKNTRGLVPADVLDSIRQNINDFLVSPAGKRATPQEALGVAPIRNQLVKTIGQHAPGYSDYLAAYAKHSEPVNTMQAAQSILDRVNNRALNSAGAAPLSLSDINVGLSKIDRGRYGVSPKAQADLAAIQDSLKQEGISNSFRSPGSDTAYNLNAQGALTKNLLGPTFGGPTGRTRFGAAALGALVGDHFGGPGGAAAGAGIGAFFNKAANVVNARIMDEYAKGLLNPQDAATMIRGYLKGNPTKAQALLARYPQWGALISSSSKLTQTPPQANP